MATNATSYRLDIYRLGYYGGLGARRVATITPPGPLPHSQPPCHRDSATNLVDCGTWSVSATWLVPDSAVSGLYFARAVRTDDYATRGRAGCANWRVDQSQLLEDLHHGRPGSDGYRPPLPERHAYVPPRREHLAAPQAPRRFTGVRYRLGASGFGRPRQPLHEPHASHIWFIVREDHRPSDLVFQTADTTCVPLLVRRVR